MKTVSKTVPRNRFQPTSRGQKIYASPGVLFTLGVLQRYRYLPSHYVATLAGLSYTYCKSTLFPRLFHERLVFCPPEGMQSYNARYRHRIMAITEQGENFLRENGRYIHRQKTKEPFRHKFMGELARASFELAAFEVPYLSIMWGKDILKNPHCPQSTRDDPEPFAIPVNGGRLKPDDQMMGYRYKRPGNKPIYIFFLREDDRDTEPLEARNAFRSSLARRFDSYLELERQGICKTRYGVGACLFLFLTINTERMRSMMQLTLKLTDGKGSRQFCFKTVNDFASYEAFPAPTGYMATEPWLRAGHPPLAMIEELQKASGNAPQT
jgi:hypothetical protein